MPDKTYVTTIKMDRELDDAAIEIGKKMVSDGITERFPSRQSAIRFSVLEMRNRIARGLELKIKMEIKK